MSGFPKVRTQYTMRYECTLNNYRQGCSRIRFQLNFQSEGLRAKGPAELYSNIYYYKVTIFLMSKPRQQPVVMLIYDEGVGVATFILNYLNVV